LTQVINLLEISHICLCKVSLDANDRCS